MRIEERIGNHVFCYDTELTTLFIDEFNPELEFTVSKEGIKTLINMFEFIKNNKFV